MKNYYMNGYLDSLDKPVTAFNRAQQPEEILKSTGYKLTKFMTDVQHLLDELNISSKDDKRKEPKTTTFLSMKSLDKN